MQIDLVWLIVSAAVALAVGILAGVLVRKSIGEKKIGSAEVEAKRILEDSKKMPRQRRRNCFSRQRKRFFACVTKPSGI